ncbi:hypothetical protein ACFL2W_00625 [Candidatus Omnitrophota bacterium]
MASTKKIIRSIFLKELINPLWTLACLPVIFHTAYLLNEWYIVSAIGSGRGIIIRTVLFFGYGLLSLLFKVLLPFSVIGLFLRKTRKKSFIILIVSLMFLLCGFFSFHVGQGLRKHAFGKLAQRSTALIKAIGSFEDDHGYPPATLNRLIPEYIDAIPETGMGTYPVYKYLVGRGAEIRHNNPWVLYVEAPPGYLDWSNCIYYPRQNYPQADYFGVFEKVGDWGLLYNRNKVFLDPPS